MQRDPINAETKRRGGVLFITIVVIFSFLLLRVLLYQTVDFDRYREKVLLQKTLLFRCMKLAMILRLYLLKL